MAFRKVTASIGSGDAIEEWQVACQRLTTEGVPRELAEFTSASHHLYSLLSIVEAARLSGETTSKIASVQFALGEKLHLHWFSKQLHEYQAGSQWEALAGNLRSVRAARRTLNWINA